MFSSIIYVYLYISMCKMQKCNANDSNMVWTMTCDSHFFPVLMSVVIIQQHLTSAQELLNFKSGIDSQSERLDCGWRWGWRLHLYPKKVWVAFIWFLELNVCLSCESKHINVLRSLFMLYMFHIYTTNKVMSWLLNMFRKFIVSINRMHINAVTADGEICS